MQLREVLAVVAINVACTVGMFYHLKGQTRAGAPEFISVTAPALPPVGSVSFPPLPKQEAQRGIAMVANGLTVQGSGWKTVAHYRGNISQFNDHFGFQHEKWTSQVGQDKTIASIFNQSKGLFFVDLAANDAVGLSNSFALEQVLDWRGLCIEINPEYIPKLTQRKCHVAVAAVGRSTGGIATFSMENVFGGLVGERFNQKTINKRLEKQGIARGVQVPLVSLEKIFTDFGVPNVIHYMSLDIEGAELYAFELFPWHKYKFLTMTVELPKNLRPVLELNDYVYVRDIDFDELYIHKTLPNFKWVMETYGTRRPKVQKE